MSPLTRSFSYRCSQSSAALERAYCRWNFIKAAQGRQTVYASSKQCCRHGKSERIECVEDDRITEKCIFPSFSCSSPCKKKVEIDKNKSKRHNRRKLNRLAGHADGAGDNSLDTLFSSSLLDVMSSITC
eukprot:766661-Hanusia_phi.AAC.3